ncbi:MAG: glycosyltransferase family 2 protein [Mariniblastus sp.]|nr:glycosyltransferase family 2 protein [Mariniblastus sp.]
MGKTQIDIVIPVFNEIEIMDQLHSRVVNACEKTQLRYRIIYVDDGSHDGTPQWINRFAIGGSNSMDRSSSVERAELDSTSVLELSVHQDHIETRSPHGSVTLLNLSRNFGQPAAILAGLTHSQGDSVVIMDGDLQDPPELIPEMVEKWQMGDEVVIAQRTSRKETFGRGLAFKLFHRCFRYLSDSNIPPNTGTFCLLDRKAANSIIELPESHRFFPGLRAWVGFNQSMIQFSRPPRAGGEPKQSFFKFSAMHWMPYLDIHSNR